MATTVFKIDKGELGLSLTPPVGTLEDATIADYSAFSCVVTSGALIATQNFDTEEIPGTFCDPAGETNAPTASTFTIDATVLQDPQDDAVTGLAKFLYDNDSGFTGNTVYFYIALADGGAPKARGECYIAPQDFGGDARVVLTSDVSFPVEGRPEIEFGVTADV